MAPLRVGWFSTGRGPSSRALLRAAMDAIARGLPVEIACVFCNRESGEDPNTDEFLQLAGAYGLPVVTLSASAFRKRVGGKVARKGEPLPLWREQFDAEALRLLEPYGIAVGVLAGYMLIFGAAACERLALLNLHPAAPGGPIGIWQDVVWELIATRAERSGITIFRAIPEVDAGPPISFCTYALHDEGSEPLWAQVAGRSVAELQREQGEALPLFQEIRRRGVVREPVMIIETLRALAERGVPALGECVAPLDLTDFVEAELARRP